jgi:hypothetical protein
MNYCPIVIKPDCVIENFDKFWTSGGANILLTIGKLGTYKTRNAFRAAKYLHCLMHRTVVNSSIGGGYIYVHEFRAKDGNYIDLIKVGLAKNVFARLKALKKEVQRFKGSYEYCGTWLVLPAEKYSQAAYIEEAIHDSLWRNGCGYSGEYYTDDLGTWKTIVAWYVSAVIAATPNNTNRLEGKSVAGIRLNPSLKTLR